MVGTMLPRLKMNDVHREGKGFQGEIYGGLLKVVRQQNGGDQLAIAMVSGEGWRCPLEKDEELFWGGGNGSSRSWYENRRVLKREGVLFIG